MMNYGIKTSRPITEKYVEAAAKGMNAKIVSHDKALASTDCNKVVFMGVLRGTHLVYRWAEAKGIDFYYIDRPYWGESRRTPYWMRCVKNQHVKTFVDNITFDDRFKKTFKDVIKPFHKNGKYVLVVPPSHAMAEMFGGKEWLDNTLKILKKNTDRELVIREKPFNPNTIIDAQGRLQPGNSKNKQPTQPFEWDKIHAVVTFNSSITIKALANGVPCFANFDNPCLPICETDFAKIETPMYEDPRPVFYSLAYGQFTQEEFRNGYAMEILDGQN